MLDQAQLNAAEVNIIGELNGGLKNVKNALNPIDEYLLSYPPMRRTSKFYCTTAQTVGGAFDEHAIIAIACIAYNWINNHILTYWDTDGNDHVDGRTILHAQNINTSKEAIEFVQGFERPPINTPGAWVGLSKVLHFINPNFFPMWDKHVARNFNPQANDNWPANKDRYIYAITNGVIKCFIILIMMTTRVLSGMQLRE